MPDSYELKVDGNKVIKKFDRTGIEETAFTSVLEDGETDLIKKLVSSGDMPAGLEPLCRDWWRMGIVARDYIRCHDQQSVSSALVEQLDGALRICRDEEEGTVEWLIEHECHEFYNNPQYRHISASMIEEREQYLMARALADEDDESSDATDEVADTGCEVMVDHDQETKAANEAENVRLWGLKTPLIKDNVLGGASNRSNTLGDLDDDENATTEISGPEMVDVSANSGQMGYFTDEEDTHADHQPTGRLEICQSPVSVKEDGLPEEEDETLNDRLGNYFNYANNQNNLVSEFLKVNKAIGHPAAELTHGVDDLGPKLPRMKATNAGKPSLPARRLVQHRRSPVS